jgi:hypothetical protein
LTNNGFEIIVSIAEVATENKRNIAFCCSLKQLLCRIYVMDQYYFTISNLIHSARLPTTVDIYPTVEEFLLLRNLKVH